MRLACESNILNTSTPLKTMLVDMAALAALRDGDSIFVNQTGMKPRKHTVPKIQPLQGCLFEEDFLVRTLGSIAQSSEVALTELVANAWDAGAAEDGGVSFD